jgi:hypothetical protein
MNMATHLIQFPAEAEYRRAVAALSAVPQTRVGLPDFKMVVTDEHLVALDQAGIPYVLLTKVAGRATLLADRHRAGGVGKPEMQARAGGAA